MSLRSVVLFTLQTIVQELELVSKRPNSSNVSSWEQVVEQRTVLKLTTESPVFEMPISMCPSLTLCTSSRLSSISSHPTNQTSKQSLNQTSNQSPNHTQQTDGYKPTNMSQSDIMDLPNMIQANFSAETQKLQDRGLDSGVLSVFLTYLKTGVYSDKPH